MTNGLLLLLCVEHTNEGVVMNKFVTRDSSNKKFINRCTKTYERRLQIMFKICTNGILVEIFFHV